MHATASSSRDLNLQVTLNTKSATKMPPHKARTFSSVRMAVQYSGAFSLAFLSSSLAGLAVLAPLMPAESCCCADPGSALLLPCARAPDGCAAPYVVPLGWPALLLPLPARCAAAPPAARGCSDVVVGEEACPEAGVCCNGGRGGGAGNASLGAGGL